MSILNNAFWHKGQRDVVGSQALGNVTLAVDDDEKVSAAAVEFMIQGVGGKTAAVSLGTTTTLVAANWAGGLHANNPATSRNDDSEASSVFTRQNFVGLSVDAYSKVYVILTTEAGAAATHANQAETESLFHWYAGEIVPQASTPTVPVLDLSAEAPLARILMHNNTAAAILPSAATAKEMMTIDGIIMIPSE